MYTLIVGTGVLGGPCLVKSFIVLFPQNLDNSYKIYYNYLVKML